MAEPEAVLDNLSVGTTASIPVDGYRTGGGDSQHILFNGLTPGVEYTVQIRALGGSTGQSDWSDVSKHRSL